EACPKLRCCEIGGQPKLGWRTRSSRFIDPASSRSGDLNMDHNRWERIQSLFHQTADLPTAEQDAFLQAACAHDSALIHEVSAMLKEDARPASLLDRGIA